jgi:hypothetical protein
MSGINTPHTPQAPSIRSAAEALLAELPAACFAESGDWLAVSAAANALKAALAEPERSRPGVLPDVPLAMHSIEAMKHGAPIEPAGIRAIVELAELGYEELASFDLRWAATMRAVARWREAHPGNELVLPDHADLVVWLMDVLDCSFDHPKVAEVEMVLGRLKGAMLRMPNALTRDATKLIEDMATAMRKLARRAFIAEQGKPPEEGGRPVLFRGDILTLTGDGRDAPLRPSSIGEVTLDLKADVGDALGMLAVWSDGVALLIEAKDELEGAAQHYADEPNRDGYLACSGLAAKIEAFLERAPIDPDAATGCADDRSPLGDAVGAIVHPPQPVPGVYSEHQGKNTADYDRRQLEARVNAKLAQLGPDAEVAACVHDIAPGWEYAENGEAGGPPFVTLTRYAPGDPL